MAFSKASLTFCLFAVAVYGINGMVEDGTCSSGAPQRVWANVRVNGANVKCHETCAQDGCVTVADQSDCLNRAVAAGHNFYSYRSHDRRCSTSSSCQPKIAAAGWHSFQAMWNEVKHGNFKCHTKCSERLCFTVASQAECQSYSLQLGVKFYSYRDFDKRCAPTVSCNNITATRSGMVAWRAYSSDDAVMEENQTVWSVVGATDSRKCHANCSSAECVTVANQAACRGLAVASGHTYYSYRQFDRMCTTSNTCDDDQSVPTKVPWMAYQAMWDKVQIIDGNAKCHSSCMEGGCAQVTNRGQCQRRADRSGHKFYSYRPSDKMCITTPVCDNPKTAAVDWRIFAAM